MKLLITGGCGFLGSNLAAAALRRGDSLTVLDHLERTGSRENLEWLKSQGDFEFVPEDVRRPEAVRALVRRVRPDMIFHLAGQVAMTVSLLDPRLDFETNALGTFNVLEAVRLEAPGCGIAYSSTNKVYGDLAWVRCEEGPTRWTTPDHPRGFDETTPLDFHSPYGCSKGAADQYIRDYARMYGLKTVVFRHSSMYGGRQFATIDQGWIGWFCGRAAAAKRGADEEPFTISGDGKQVRDVLHADDMVALYFAAAERLHAAGEGAAGIAGRAFNIGGGPANSLSLLELFALLEEMLDVRLNYRRLPPRESDQRVFVADVSAAEKWLDWSPRVSARSGLAAMLEWIASR